MSKVLLADDQPKILRLLEIPLRAEGHTVLKAQDGEEALRIARAERPDALILDVLMPGLNGLRVLSRLKSDPELAGMPVVMLTAQSDPEDQRLGLDLGADYYLCKPFDPRDVTALIRRILPAGASSSCLGRL
jgi:DNA-binding response OmpR family regulator